MFVRNRLGLALALLVALAGCKQAPPPETAKPARKSFEDSSQPSSASEASSAQSNTEAEAKAAQDSWDKARQAGTDAERERAAQEALQHTQQMSEPAGAPPPAP